MVLWARLLGMTFLREAEPSLYGTVGGVVTHGTMGGVVGYGTVEGIVTHGTLGGDVAYGTVGGEDSSIIVVYGALG